MREGKAASGDRSTSSELNFSNCCGRLKNTGTRQHQIQLTVLYLILSHLKPKFRKFPWELFPWEKQVRCHDISFKRKNSDVFHVLTSLFSRISCLGSGSTSTSSASSPKAPKSGPPIGRGSKLWKHKTAFNMAHRFVNYAFCKGKPNSSWHCAHQILREKAKGKN